MHAAPTSTPTSSRRPATRRSTSGERRRLLRLLQLQVADGGFRSRLPLRARVAARHRDPRSEYRLPAGGHRRCTTCRRIRRRARRSPGRCSGDARAHFQVGTYGQGALNALSESLAYLQRIGVDGSTRTASRCCGGCTTSCRASGSPRLRRRDDVGDRLVHRARRSRSASVRGSSRPTSRSRSSGDRMRVSPSLLQRHARHRAPAERAGVSVAPASR